ncbi:MAG TPA: rod shape-determining protein MreC [Actinomycetota bacterium]
MAVSRRDRGTRLLVIGLILASLVTITADFRGGKTGPLAALGDAALEIITPLQRAVSNVIRPIGSFFTDIFQVSSIKAENAELKRKLDEIQGEQELVQQLERENAEYELLLELEEAHALETVGARVIGGEFSNFEWTVTIDKGSSDGIGVDMPVLAPGGLAGRVVATTSSAALVELVIDPGSGVEVRLSKSGEHGLLIGHRDQPLLLDLIDIDTPVEPGEAVETSGRITPGLDRIFPPGILVGEVAEIIPDESGLDREILVRPIVDFSRLSVVSVVLAEQPDPDDFLPED